ncbi:MAG: ABC transporter permease subunit [Firmicutes bacterium]|nr:ABC transporter permease subunit [Bacillota bacterium]
MNDKTGEKRIGTKIAAALLWLAVWQIASMALGKSFVLPSPVFTCQRLFQLCMQGSFWQSCAVTLLRVAAGLALACLLGFACALAAQKNRTVREILAVPAAVIRSVPVMSVILIALLCMKSAAVPLFVCFLMCFPVMYTNILQGFENVPAEYRELAQVYRVTGGRYTSKILIPASMGYIKAGLSLCAGLSWKSTVAAEVLSSPRISMGYHLLTAKMYLEGADLFAWTVGIVLLSVCFEKALRFALRRW